jgi:uncharacterized sulfatase
MAGKSLWNVLRSKQSGLVDPDRTWVVTGRERHVAAAREDQLPYPQRALRTKDFLYIRNFKPDRWPMGGPGQVTDAEAPAPETLESDTFAAFADMDASPTKAWLIGRRNDPAWQWQYQYAFAKRPGEELYDLRQDPDETNNLAGDPAYAAPKKELADRLMRTLRDSGDPRVLGEGDTFDLPPYAGPLPNASR